MIINKIKGKMFCTPNIIILRPPLWRTSNFRHSGSTREAQGEVVRSCERLKIRCGRGLRLARRVENGGGGRRKEEAKDAGRMDGGREAARGRQAG
jgi:hypothetical protein